MNRTTAISHTLQGTLAFASVAALAIPYLVPTPVEAAQLQYEGTVLPSCSVVAGDTGALVVDGTNLTTKGAGGRPATVQVTANAPSELSAIGGFNSYTVNGSKRTQVVRVGWNNGTLEGIVTSSGGSGTSLHNVAAGTSTHQLHLELPDAAKVPGTHKVVQTIRCNL